MRLLWSLPKAAPALLRHLAGYAELAVEDLEQSQHDFRARLMAGALVGLSSFFVLLCLCMLVLALTWDTPYRVAAIAWMGGFFVLTAVGAFLYRSKIVGRQSVFLGTVRREWREDRILLDRILSGQDT